MALTRTNTNVLAYRNGRREFERHVRLDRYSFLVLPIHYYSNLADFKYRHSLLYLQIHCRPIRAEKALSREKKTIVDGDRVIFHQKVSIILRYHSHLRS